MARRRRLLGEGRVRAEGRPCFPRRGLRARRQHQVFDLRAGQPARDGEPRALRCPRSPGSSRRRGLQRTSVRFMRTSHESSAEALRRRKRTSSSPPRCRVSQAHSFAAESSADTAGSRSTRLPHRDGSSAAAARASPQNGGVERGHSAIAGAPRPARPGSRTRRESRRRECFLERSQELERRSRS